MNVSLIAPALEAVGDTFSSAQGYQVHHSVEALVSRGHRIRLYATEPCRTSAQECVIRLCDARYWTDEGDPSVRSRIRHLLRFSAQRDLFAAALRESRELEGQVLHLHHATVLDYAGFASTPMVCTIHFGLSDSDLKVFRALYHFYEGFPTVRFVAVSDHQRKRLEKAFGLVSRFPVIHNGIDVGEFRSREEPSTKSDYVIHIGRISPEKRTHLAIQAAKVAGISIRLCGTHQVEREGDPDYFARQILPLIDGRTVIYEGEVDSARRNQLLSRARALLFTSDESEAFGMCILESMACGTPVIALDCAAAPELIDHGVSGFLATDPAEMAVIIQGMRSLPPEQIRAHVARNFAFGRMVEKYERVYADAVRAGMSSE